jgi:hypothetical protein
LDEYPQIERNPIVPRMARIVMTTISSMRVKPLNFFDPRTDSVGFWVGKEFFVEFINGILVNRDLE